jgi:hypothetical protein
VTIDSALRSYLLGDTAIAALVGTQIFPDVLPQNVLKSPNDSTAAITYTTVSAQRPQHLRGVGIAKDRYQIDTWARTQDRAAELGALIRRRLDGLRDYWSDHASPATATWVVILFQTERDMVEPEINGGLGRNSADYFVMHGTAGGVL